MKYGSLFDATQTMVSSRLLKICTRVQVVSWYDNENSYTSQMVRTIKYFRRTGLRPDDLWPQAADTVRFFLVDS